MRPALAESIPVHATFGSSAAFVLVFGTNESNAVGNRATLRDLQISETVPRSRGACLRAFGGGRG